MATALTIGDRSRDGLLEVTDTNWNSNGTMYVTVRELIGGVNGWIGGWSVLRPKMRRFARRALTEHYKGQTRSVRMIRTWYAQGCQHATFAVSRHER